jgi:polar amino acid transport system substrate-binding protein
MTTSSSDHLAHVDVAALQARTRELEQRLADLTAIHQSVFDSLARHIAVLDEHGVIVAVNRAWREFANANGADDTTTGVGTNYLAVCEAAVRSGGDDSARRALAGLSSVLRGDSIRFEMEYPCNGGGQRRWFHLRVTPMEGGHRGVVVSHADITARIEAEIATRAVQQEMENRQFAIDQHAIIAVTDRHGRITQVNDLFCSISGYAREELLGQDHRLINSGVHPKEFFAGLWATIRAGEVWRGEVCNRAKAGSLYWVSTTVVPLCDDAGKPHAYMAIRTDITLRKQTEQRLVEARDRAEQLNLELKTRIAQANDLAVKAERASEVKSIFVANMSHEIRTPMNGIMGMIEVLMNTPLSAEQEDYLRTAYHSAESLMGIINDILDFSKLEANRLVLEQVEFNLHELVFQVAELFRSQLIGRPVEMLVSIKSEVPYTVIGDPGRLRQILSNLVANAVKFTQAGHIRIDVRRTDTDFVVAVGDTGIGIPADKLEQLFTPFTQLDHSYSRNYGGTGLGLAISRRFATLMNGTLTVSSTLGSGSVFTITVPLKVVMAPKPIPHPPHALAGLRVLLLDDNQESCQITCQMLCADGLRAESCGDGAQALELLRCAIDDPFALAIVDLRLMHMSGIEFARVVRSDQKLRALPLMMLTGSGQPEEPAVMERAGFNAYLVKPVRSAVLHSVLVEMVARCRSGRPGLVTRYDVVEGEMSSGRPAATIDADVLLVEDHEVNMKIATVALGKLGARVSIADNGRVAVEMVMKRPYDVVLMDCQMPEMDGYEATQAIRMHERRIGAKRLPIIAMTANVMPGSRERCLAAGMDDFLAKPFRVHQLEEKLRRWLDSSPTAVDPLPDDSAETPSAPHGELPIIDIGILREIERGDAGMAASILQVFRNRLAQDLVLIQEQLAAGDVAAVTRVAHKIKGSSGSIGAMSLHTIAAELNSVAQTGDLEQCRALVADLERVARIFLATIRLESLPALLIMPPGE